MIIAKKGNKSIKTTEKMFNTVYKAQGFVLAKPVTPPNASPEKSLGEVNVTELRTLAKQRGITGASQKGKDELIKLLSGQGGGENGNLGTGQSD